MGLETEFEVYRSLGYLSTGDVIQSTGFTKNELFYLLSTGFPIIKPIRIPLQGLGKELNAYLFSDRDLYILTLVKRMKEKYSLQRLRGMFNTLLRYRKSEELDGFAEHNYKLICQAINHYDGEALLTKEEVERWGSRTTK